MALKGDWDELKKGDWCFLNDNTYIAVMFGNDRFLETCVLPIATIEQHATHQHWVWDGNKEAPSLTPSILVWGNGKDRPATWHGFLRAGKLETA